MFQPGPNDALSQNFMKLGVLVVDKNVDGQTDKHRDRQDSCFISSTTSSFINVPIMNMQIMHPFSIAYGL